MVNFHALASYIEKIGGAAVIQSQRSDIKTVAFYTGFQMSDLPEFSTAVYENIERISPADYFILHRNISENFQHCKLNTLISHLAFSDWDPHIYEKLSRQINEQVVNADKSVLQYLLNHLPNLSSNFYFMPRTYDVHFDLAILLHSLHRYHEALEYYKKSEQFYGERFNLIYNMAICLYHSGDSEEALNLFNRALYLNPDSTESRSWVEFLKK
jgi:tetratricopeptide (TPR) repeat protein